MSFSDEIVNAVYDKTGGYCTYCEKRLSFKNYGNLSGMGAWEIDHSIPISRGGTDHLNNLVPACVDCNRLKGDMTAQEFRRWLQNQ